MYAEKIFNGDYTHPISHFQTGDKTTLQIPNIAENEYSFYQQYYAKNKLRIATVCNRDFTTELSEILSNSEEITIPDQRPPQNKLKAPKITQNRLIIVRGESPDSLSISKSFDLEQKDLGYLEFITSVWDNVLTKILILEEALINSITTSHSMIKEYANVELSMELSLKGKEKIEPILHIVYGVLNSLESLFNKEIFDDVKRISQISFDLEDKPQDAFDFSSDLLRSFIDNGFTRIKEGYSVKSLNFDKNRILSIWKDLRKAKSIIIFVGRVKSSRTKGSNLKPGLNFEASNQLANLAGKYKQADLLQNRLVDYSYLGLKGRNHLNQYQGLVQIDFYHKQFQLEAGYIFLDNQLDQRTQTGVKYTPNPFQISEKTLRSMTEAPGNVVKTLFATKAFYSRLNTKHSFNSFGVFIDIYTEVKPSGKLNCDLTIIEIILGKRLQLINEKLSDFNSGISVSQSNGQLTLEILTTPDNIQPVTKIVFQRLFNGDRPGQILIKESEKKYALDKYYSILDNKITVLGYYRDILNSVVNGDLVLRRSAAKHYLRDIDQTGLNIPNFRVGKIYVEGHVDNKINEFIINELARKIDHKYYLKQSFDLSPYKHPSLGFKEGKTVVIGFESMRKEDKNQVYIHIFHTNHKTSNVEFYSKIRVLRSILHDLAFYYLRTKKQLGYIVQAYLINHDGEIMIAVLAQTANVAKAKIEFENFYRIAEKKFKELTEEKVRSIVANEISGLRSEYPSVYAEAGDNHSNLDDGLLPDYSLRLAEYLEKGKVTAKSISELYGKIFSCQESRKMIFDSTVQEGKKGYSVGENGYVKGEKFEVVWFKD